MNRQDLIQLVNACTDSFEDYPFNNKQRHETIVWTVMKQKSNHKIIALIFEKNDELMIDLKLRPEHGEMMREYKGVFPGYHMNKAHWNTVTVNDTDISQAELIEMIRESDVLTS
ncbi:MmcQ/YjbR family DNA-binding protein [uncultured Leuconostoc sp.]|uniref:MmcQ/YjbR family DNA-binding protein n=1 Tax=uncultured Leuconostoc sp. TaxID=173262 RepID=UPI0025F2D963|nr:MmcQ/YjbR family DNA-binding protein [uncultured Leuconostoc sp.]